MSEWRQRFGGESDSHQDMGREPAICGHEGGAMRLERTKTWAATGNEIGPPATGLIRFDTTRATNRPFAELPEQDRFAVETVRPSGQIDEQLAPQLSSQTSSAVQQTLRGELVASEFCLDRFHTATSTTLKINHPAGLALKPVPQGV